MAGIKGVASPASEIALTATQAKTVLQLVAGANSNVRIKEWGVYFDGQNSAAEPVQVRLLRQTTAGTMTALTPVQRNGPSITLLTTAQHTATAEPTAGNVLANREVHPQSGYQEKFAPGDEIELTNGGRVGIECIAPAGVNCRPEIVFEE